MDRLTKKNVALGLLVFCLLVLMVLILQNTSPVEARFLWFVVETPIILLLVLTTIGGFISGVLVTLYFFVGGKSGKSKPKGAKK